MLKIIGKVLYKFDGSNRQVVRIEEYEKSLNLEAELFGIGRKVALDVLGRAGFKVWNFPASCAEADRMRSALEDRLFYALRDYMESLQEEETRELPDLLAEKDNVLYVISLVLNQDVLPGPRMRVLSRARDFRLVPVLFRAAVEVSIPYSSLELLQKE